MHEACDYLAVSNLILRQAVGKLFRNDPMKVREEVVNRLISIVLEYVQEESSKVRNSLFMAHPSLSPAFAYVHSFINSQVVMNHIKMPSDFRIL